MIHITYGDHGPRVVLLQALLRMRGHDVPMNGLFDRTTWNAAVNLRIATGHEPVGPINSDIFASLLSGRRLKVIHSVDAQAGEVRVEAEKDLRKRGIDPLLIKRHIGHGVEDAVNQIIRRCQGFRMAMLRFIGHGNEGTWMSIAVGNPFHEREHGIQTPAYKAMKADWRSYISLAHLADHLPTLVRLKPYFAPYGSVELHACRIGSQTAMIKRLADLWGVPVSGGWNIQSVGLFPIYDRWGYEMTPTQVFEGPVFTAYPFGLTMEEWAARMERWVPVRDAA